MCLKLLGDFGVVDFMQNKSKKNIEHHYLTDADAMSVRTALAKFVEEVSNASICMLSPNVFRINTKDGCVKLNMLSSSGCTRIAMSFKSFAISLWHKLMKTLTRCFLLRSAAPIKIKDNVVVESKPETKAKTVADVVLDYINNKVDNTRLIFSYKATDQALNCPFRHTKKLESVLHRLNIAANVMYVGQHRGKSLHNFFLKDVGLPVTFNLSDTQEQKFGEDYDAEHGGRLVRGRMHVTIGAGNNEAECMSVHFIYCEDCKAIVITRCGAHGRTAR